MAKPFSGRFRKEAKKLLVVLSPKAKAASNSSENLCLKCTNYSYKKYSLDDKEMKVCTANKEFVLRGPISECSDFYDSTELNLHSMKEMAWIIEASKKKVGFGAEMEIDVDIIPPSQRKKGSLDNI